VDACVAAAAPPAGPGDRSAWRFRYATGSSLPSAWPELPASRAFRSPCVQVASQEQHHGGHGITWPDHLYAKKVKLSSKAAVKGGCG
jgi:hypothetical protein